MQVQRQLFLWAAMLAAALPVRGQVAAPTVPQPLRPSAIAFDSAGNLYFADAARHMVYEVSLAGTLSVVAGTGTQGFAGDGGSATAALLNEPHGLAVSQDGTIYLADTGNCRVRAIRAGIISTVAGQGRCGYGGDGGPAPAALLNRPWGLALASDGGLYIADSANQRVRVMRASTLATIAGSGLEGASGDGGAATQAALRSPEGVAMAPDGRLLIADTGNARVRVVSGTGSIDNFAGEQTSGFGGEGAPGAQAKFFRPSGIAVSATGEVYVADGGNQRVRKVALDGTVTTIAGGGLQGASADGSAVGTSSLDGPESVAISPFERVWFTDARNRTVRAVTADRRLFQPAGLVSRATTLAVQPSLDAGGHAVLGGTIAGGAGIAQGSLSVSEGGQVLATASLFGGAVSLPLPSLGPGAHALVMQYSGDVLNPSATAAVSVPGSTPGVLVATANAASIRFGEEVPTLTGDFAGAAPPDLGRVQVSFTTSATSSSAAGTYPIVATLSGPAAAAYTVQLSAASGQLVISAQASATALLTPLPVGYDGLPLSLTAIVSSVARSKPSGSVTFLENGNVLATANVVNGSATGVLPSITVGQHVVVARYAGDGNFLPSDATSQTIAVNTLPDFTLTRVDAATPTMNPGSAATFDLRVASAPAPFTGAVALSVAGLPTGWTVRFAPTNVVPGLSSAAVALTVTASGIAEGKRWNSPNVMLAVLLLPGTFLMRRRWRVAVLLPTGALLSLTLLSGCGDRVASTADIVPPHPASLTVTGTATNLAGRVVTHSVVIAYLQP